MDWQPLHLSLKVAVGATLLAGGIGVPLALLIAWRRMPGRDLLDAITTAPMVMPPTVLGYYLLIAFGRTSALGRAYEALTGAPIVFTLAGAVLAATVGSLPLVIKAARPALEGVDPTLIRAARTLGAGPVRAFFTVHLPLAARGIYAGLILAFARALGDFGVTLMVAGNIPGETQTAALAIYDSILAHRDQDAAALAIVLATFTVVVLYGVNKLMGRPNG